MVNFELEVASIVTRSLLAPAFEYLSPHQNPPINLAWGGIHPTGLFVIPVGSFSHKVLLTWLSPRMSVRGTLASLKTDTVRLSVSSEVLEELHALLFSQRCVVPLLKGHKSLFRRPPPNLPRPKDRVFSPPANGGSASLSSAPGLVLFSSAPLTPLQW